MAGYSPEVTAKGGTIATKQSRSPTDFGMVQGPKKMGMHTNPLAASMPKNNHIGDPLKGQPKLQNIARMKVALPNSNSGTGGSVKGRAKK